MKREPSRLVIAGHANSSALLKSGTAATPKGRKPSVPVEEVLRLKAEGLGASVIAKQLGIARSSVYEALKGA